MGVTRADNAQNDRLAPLPSSLPVDTILHVTRASRPCFATILRPKPPAREGIVAHSPSVAEGQRSMAVSSS